MKGRLTVLDEVNGGCEPVNEIRTSEVDGYIPARGTFQGRAALVTLGCAKNQVDSEVMLGVLQSSGFEIVSDLAEADVAIVNTCGFLQSAVQESVDRILDAAEYKESGRLKKLIVAGCMVERYQADLKKEMPEVDSFLTTDDLLSVADVAGGEFPGFYVKVLVLIFCMMTRFRVPFPEKHFAYVKIAEGCDRPCTFCIIPRIRGKMRSREIASVVREVQDLAFQGVREVNLLAQDLTSYGKDNGQTGGLPALLRELDQSTAVDWIRLLYAYPIGIDESLLRAIEDLPRVCEYLDIPLQHSSTELLKRMKRPVGRYAARKLVEFMRKCAPSVQLRTTFIVGFPGETEEDIRDLEVFVAEGHFSSVGVFTYSQEKGTPSAEMEGQLEEQVKVERRERIMFAQQSVMDSRLQAYQGARLPVLVDGFHQDTNLLWCGRTRFQAPEVDGIVIINDVKQGSEEELRAGAIGTVEITEVAGYDLIGSFERGEK